MPKFICNYTFEWGLTFTVFKRNGKWLNYKVYVLNVADRHNDFTLQMCLLMYFHFHFFQGKRRRDLGGRKWAGGTRRGQNRQQRGGRFSLSLWKIILKWTNKEWESFSRLMNLSLCVKRFQPRTLFSLSAGCCRPTRSLWQRFPNISGFTYFADLSLLNVNVFKIPPNFL